MENIISTEDLYLIIQGKEEKNYSIARKIDFKYYDIFTNMEYRKSNSKMTPIHIRSTYLSEKTIKEALNEWNSKEPCKKLIRK